MTAGLEAGNNREADPPPRLGGSTVHSELTGDVVIYVTFRPSAYDDLLQLQEMNTFCLL